MPSLLWVNHFAVTLETGGATRHFEMGRELTKLGWDVTIAASDFDLQTRRYTRRKGPDDRRTLDEVIDGVRMRWVWASPYRGNNWRRAVNWLTFAHGLGGLTDLESTDVVIGSSPHLFAALAAQRLARRWHAPFVFEVRDLWPESMTAAGGRAGLIYHAFGRIARHLYATADHIIVLARGSATHIAARGVPSQNISFIPNGVDVAAFAVDRDTRSSLRLIYTGAHGPANGLTAILDAAERLRDHTEISWLLIGDGPAKPDLITAARQRGLTSIEFRDPVPKHAMPALLAEVDAGLMVLRETPLFRYGVSPNKLFDYMGAALPVACNVGGDVADMLHDAGAGEQATDGSGAALADAVLRLMSRSATERSAMGTSGQRWVTQHHNRSLLAGQLDVLLRSVSKAHAVA
ncbi:MAG: RfaG7 [Gemmatimonadetes bacterium]|nr:RfaG7 [Gemmatimonadota bacterium]